MRAGKRFDYIVVGSGSAGGLLATRLSENPDVNVLLMEAGSGANHWSIKIPGAVRNNYVSGSRNWCFHTEPEPFMHHRRIFQPRGKVLGGSSSINGMVFVRGHARDFEGWERAGAKGWGYDDVLPNFRNLENYIPGGNEFRGNGGVISVDRLFPHHPMEQDFLDAAVQAGYMQCQDYNGSDQEGVSGFDASIGGGYRSGTAAILDKIRHRDNLVIHAEAHVSRVLIDNTQATGIEFVSDGQLHTVDCEGEVILCAGAFQSPQILMLSGVGPGNVLRQQDIQTIVDLPGVGQNLQDHLEVHIKFKSGRGTSNNRLLRKHRMLLAGLQWLLFKSGSAATAHSRVGGFLRTDDSVDYPNMQFHFWPYFLEGWSPPPDKDGYCFDVGPVRSESRGWVTLGSTNPLDPPRIQLNGLSLEKDMEEFRQSIRMARDIASQKAFDFWNGQEVSPGPEVHSDTDLDHYVRANANSAYHPCGTCKIGSDDMAVVDPLLKVYGIDRLRVADASVMPNITNGNINAPSLMIGDKAADIILGDARGPGLD